MILCIQGKYQFDRISWQTGMLPQSRRYTVHAQPIHSTQPAPPFLAVWVDVLMDWARVSPNGRPPGANLQPARDWHHAFPPTLEADWQTILDYIQRHRISLIQGESGCGKSSAIPQYILQQEPSARILVTQPTRLAAVALARHVGAQLGNRRRVGCVRTFARRGVGGCCALEEGGGVGRFA